MIQRHSFIASTLIGFGILLAASGCSTYEPMTKDDQNEGYPKSEDAIRVTLSDGSIIESSPFLHLFTHEPSDVIVGVGQDRSKGAVFKGLINVKDLDSVKKFPTANEVFLVCWLKNKTSLGFNNGDYLILTSKDPPGFWCAGRKTTSTGTVDFNGMLTRDKIADIEVRKFAFVATARLAAVTVGPVVIFYFLIEAVRGRLNWNM
jgi:hypothetical protein